MSSFWSESTESGIYRILNLVTGNAYYGSAANFRIRSRTHLLRLLRGDHHSIKLQRSWNKYGLANFRFEIVERCDRSKLLEREQFYIDQGDNLNICTTAGSTLGRNHSDETKAKIAKRAEGRKMPERDAAYRKRLSDVSAGKKKPAHVMEALQRGRKAQVYTDERKAKIGESLKEAYVSGRRPRVKSEEHRNKIGKAFAALSDDQVRDIRMRIAASETGRSIAAEYGIPASLVSAIKNRKRYKWVD